jgi:hypothetical protein
MDDDARRREMPAEGSHRRIAAALLRTTGGSATGTNHAVAVAVPLFAIRIAGSPTPRDSTVPPAPDVQAAHKFGSQVRRNPSIRAVR